MTGKIAPILAAASLAALVGCGAHGKAGNPPKGEARMASTPLPALTLTSDAFKDGQPIPAQFTCDGAGMRPAVHWSDPPTGTKSFALVVDDPDAPSGIFRHWGAYDIPATARSIGADEKVGTEVANDFGKAGYGGPCPPKGHGPHHYHFKLFALDTDQLGLSPDAKAADVEKAASGHAIAQGELIGTYERK